MSSVSYVMLSIEMAISEQALKETAEYLMARAAGESSPKLSIEAATEAVVLILDATLPSSTGREIVDALRAAAVADDVRVALAGPPAQIISAEDVLKDALLRGQVQNRILQERLLDADAVGTLLGSQSESNLRQYANTQRLRGELLGIPRLNAYLYPEFQFDTARGRIYETARSINQQLDAKNDPWGVASWWTTSSERLGNRAPKDLLGTDDEPELRLLADADLAPVG